MKKIALLMVIVLMASSVLADNRQFFRVAADATTVIVDISSDGWLTWSNALVSGTCTLERASSLSGTNIWHSYAKHSVTSQIMTTRFYNPVCPSGMILIPAGTFSMGDNFGEGDSNELPVHNVYVSAFYMDKHGVTKDTWDQVANYGELHGYDISDEDGSEKSTNHPCIDVNWYKCVKWCNALSQVEGRTVCYTVGGDVYKTGESTPDCNFSANGYRLPTEAEWEKAARGGSAGRRFPWGNTIQHACANYFSSTNYIYDTSATNGYHPDYYTLYQYPYTSPVETFAANGYGLYDMAGTVSEWCNDWGDGSYSSESVSNPHGPSTGWFRVDRGGHYSANAQQCRVACRHMSNPSPYYNTVGFRTVLSLE